LIAVATAAQEAPAVPELEFCKTITLNSALQPIHELSSKSRTLAVLDKTTDDDYTMTKTGILSF
jgi:hypothetical protein